MNFIVAVDRNWAIGKDGDQPIYIPTDLKRFKSFTIGHPIIMGRKTLATFPDGKPLKGRRNLVLSRNPNFNPEGAEVFADLVTLLKQAPEDSFVVGGASVYAALLNRCDTAYVTKIDLSFSRPDRFFANLDEQPNWYIAEKGQELEEHGIKFCYVTYKRK